MIKIFRVSYLISVYRPGSNVKIKSNCIINRTHGSIWQRKNAEALHGPTNHSPTKYDMQFSSSPSSGWFIPQLVKVTALPDGSHLQFPSSPSSVPPTQTEIPKTSKNMIKENILWIKLSKRKSIKIICTNLKTRNKNK